MRTIPASLHRLLDFVTVAAFALAPTLLSLMGPAAFLAYGLAFIHLGLTLLTRFPRREARPIPLVLHGAVEAVVGPALVALPLFTDWTGGVRAFYVAAGIVILAVWVLSEYRTVAGWHDGH